MRVSANPDSGILNLFVTEHRGGRLIINLALGGAITLVIAVAVGSLALSTLALVGLVALLVTIYAATLIVVTVHVVRSADRWQVDSAMQARRLLSRRGSGESPVLTTRADYFHYWLFLMRVEDAIAEARRKGVGGVNVIVLRVQYPGGEPTTAQSEQMSFDLAHLAAKYFEPSILVSALADYEYGFLLPNMSRENVRSKMSPLLNPLGDYRCDIGLAIYPDDGGNAEDLLNHARDRYEHDEREAASA